MRRAVAVCLVCLFICATCFYSMTEVFAASVPTQFNGETWYDTAGNVIDCHNQSFIKVGNTYYMFGVIRRNETQTYDNFFRGVNCYSSTDLVNWTFERTVLTADDINAGLANPRVWVAGRPKVIYNDLTQQYVMYFKCRPKDKGSDRKFALSTSSTVDGPYTFQGRHLPTGGGFGDSTLFKDDDGTAYVIYSNLQGGTRTTRIDQLSNDYLSVSHNVAVINKREAPNVFKKDGIYYLITSGASGWSPNQAKYYTATSMAGPWSAAKNFGNATTYHSQGSDVIVVQGTSKTSYIFCGDRWDSSYLGNSTYVWLPIKFNGSNIYIDWYERFNIDTQTGEWSQAEPGIKYECESLATNVSAGDSESDLTDSNCSNGAFNKFIGNALNDYVEFTVNVAAAGTYTVRVGGKSGRARGVYQMSIDGTDQGERVDLHGSGNTYPVANLGQVTFASPGSKTFRFTIVDQNPSSTGYTLSLDYIALYP